MILRIVFRVSLLAVRLFLLAVEHVSERFEYVFRVSQTVVAAVDRVDHDSSRLASDENFKKDTAHAFEIVFSARLSFYKTDSNAKRKSDGLKTTL